MPGENDLTRIRRAFKIPDSVLIVAGSKLAPKIGVNGNTGSQPTGSKYQIPQGDTPDAPIRTGILNTKVYTDIQFLSTEYTDSKGRTITTPAKTYDTVLLTVSQAKKIIMTEIQGADGTVKEYIGLDDYHIEVNGIITASNGVHPVDEIADLKKILDAPVTIDIACDYLRNLGIDSVVVSDYTIGQEPGSYSYQTFSLVLLSDIPVQLRLSGI